MSEFAKRYKEIRDLAQSVVEKIDERMMDYFKVSLDGVPRLCAQTEIEAFIILAMGADDAEPMEISPGSLMKVTPPLAPPTTIYGGLLYYGMKPHGDYGIWHDANGRPHFLDKEGKVEARGFVPVFAGNPAIDVTYVDGSLNPDVYPADVNWPRVRYFMASDIPF